MKTLRIVLDDDKLGRLETFENFPDNFKSIDVIRKAWLVFGCYFDSKNLWYEEVY